jgi:hypothetical protein
MENQKKKENQQRFEMKPAHIYREQKAHSPYKSKFLAAEG